MARALPEDGQIYTIEKDPERAKLAEETFATAEPETAKKITLLIGDAKEKLTELNAQAPFDMIFIDADKISYPAYLDWAEDNIRQGGIVIGDNSLLFDAIYLVEPPETIRKTTHKAMQEFNRRMADETKFMSVLLPTKEGMTVGVKALSQKERRSSS
jgi:predicted O-methyltransferase YrrM